MSARAAKRGKRVLEIRQSHFDRFHATTRGFNRPGSQNPRRSFGRSQQKARGR